MAIGTSRTHVLSLSDSRSRENPLEALRTFCLSPSSSWYILNTEKLREWRTSRSTQRARPSLSVSFINKVSSCSLFHRFLGKEANRWKSFFLFQVSGPMLFSRRTTRDCSPISSSIFNQRLEVRKKRYNFRSITADSDCQIDFTLIYVTTILIY